MIIIYLSAEYYFLCTINTAHPTVFVSDTRECIAVCDSHTEPQQCFKDGHSVTECYTDSGESTLCDAYIYTLNPSEIPNNKD
jgi:hypothetical protein